MRAQKMQKRAAKYNFDFSSVAQIYSKIAEETEEIRSAEEKLSSSDTPANAEALKGEIGDLLFSVVNLARVYHVDAEEALRASNDKFLSRFSALEKAIEKDGKDIRNLTEEEIDKYYNEIKKS